MLGVDGKNWMFPGGPQGPGRRCVSGGTGWLGFWALSLWSGGFAEDEASQSWALSVGAVQGSSVTPLPSCRPELKPVDKESEVMMK